MKESIVLSRDEFKKLLPKCNWERTAIRMSPFQVPIYGKIGISYVTKGQSYFIDLQSLFSFVFCFRDFLDTDQVELVCCFPPRTDSDSDDQCLLEYEILDYRDGVPADVKRIYPGSQFASIILNLRNHDHQKTD